jgi:hypothetical protein
MAAQIAGGYLASCHELGLRDVKESIGEIAKVAHELAWELIVLEEDAGGDSDLPAFEPLQEIP